MNVVQRLSNIFQMNCAFDEKSTNIGGKLNLNVLIQLKMGDTWKYMYFYIFSVKMFAPPLLKIKFSNQLVQLYTHNILIVHTNIMRSGLCELITILRSCEMISP